MVAGFDSWLHEEMGAPLRHVALVSMCVVSGAVYQAFLGMLVWLCNVHARCSKHGVLVCELVFADAYVKYIRVVNDAVVSRGVHAGLLDCMCVKGRRGVPGGAERGRASYFDRRGKVGYRHAFISCLGCVFETSAILSHACTTF